MKKNWRNVPIIKKTNLLMMLVMLLIGVANILWAEKLEINQGFGWDGMNYAAWAKDFHQTVLTGGVPDYYVKRILPSALVHYGTRLAAAPFFPGASGSAVLNQNRNVVFRFDLYNLLLLLVAVWTWGLMADELKIQRRGKWFGFVFLFLNYAILKNNFYHSVLTDTSAFTLGILMFYFFLAHKPVGLWATIFLGGFTWPSIPYMGALLFVFPYQNGTAAGESRSPNVRPGRNWPLLATLFFCGLALILFAYLKLHLAQLQGDLSRALRVDRSFFYLSIAVAVAYLLVGLKPAISDTRLFNPRRVLGSIRWSRVGILVLTFGFLHFAYHRLRSDVDIGWGSPWGLLEYIFLSALTEPAIFLVAHTLYYGPIVLLLIFFWKPLCQSIQEYGIGLQLFVTLNFILSICPQSRYQINAIPVFAVLLVKLLDGSLLRDQSLAFWALLSLLYSKVWYIFNTAPQVDDGTMDILLRFPLQHYFTNSGPWMAPQMYLIQGSVVLATVVLLYFFVVKRPPQPPILEHPEPAVCP